MQAMDRPDHNSLGPPTLEIDQLRIWIRGREFPSSLDFWDGNWLDITAHCSAGGADVWVSGPFLHLSELQSWFESTYQLNETLAGEAVLKCIEPAL